MKFFHDIIELNDLEEDTFNITLLLYTRKKRLAIFVKIPHLEGSSVREGVEYRSKATSLIISSEDTFTCLKSNLNAYATILSIIKVKENLKVRIF